MRPAENLRWVFCQIILLLTIFYVARLRAKPPAERREQQARQKRGFPARVCGKSLFAAQCRRMKFQKVSEFAKPIPTGLRNRAEVVLRNMHMAACEVLQLFAQNLAQRTARDCGNFEIFLDNPLLVNL